MSGGDEDVDARVLPNCNIILVHPVCLIASCWNQHHKNKCHTLSDCIYID